MLNFIQTSWLNPFQAKFIQVYIKQLLFVKKTIKQDIVIFQHICLLKYKNVLPSWIDNILKYQYTNLLSITKHVWLDISAFCLQEKVYWWIYLSVTVTRKIAPIIMLGWMTVYLWTDTEQQKRTVNFAKLKLILWSCSVIYCKIFSQPDIRFFH